MMMPAPSEGSKGSDKRRRTSKERPVASTSRGNAATSPRPTAASSYNLAEVDDLWTQFDVNLKLVMESADIMKQMKSEYERNIRQLRNELKKQRDCYEQTSEASTCENPRSMEQNVEEYDGHTQRQLDDLSTQFNVKLKSVMEFADFMKPMKCECERIKQQLRNELKKKQDCYEQLKKQRDCYEQTSEAPTCENLRSLEQNVEKYYDHTQRQLDKLKSVMEFADFMKQMKCEYERIIQQLRNELKKKQDCYEQLKKQRDCYEQRSEAPTCENPRSMEQNVEKYDDHTQRQENPRSMEQNVEEYDYHTQRQDRSRATVTPAVASLSASSSEESFPSP